MPKPDSESFCFACDLGQHKLCVKNSTCACYKRNPRMHD